MITLKKLAYYGMIVKTILQKTVLKIRHNATGSQLP